MEKNFKRTLITAALPYANGPVHIGHLAGVYIPSDIYARYLRLRGEEVLFVCGSDEHGVPIAIKAKKEGVTPQDIVDRYDGIIRQSFADFGITFDIYGRTTSPTHRELAASIFRTIYDKGGFIEEESEQYYDPEAKQFLADRYITGTCPRCQNERAYGDQCESCGSTLNPTDLIHPKSAISGATPELRKTKHWYLPLDKHEPFLKQWILEEHKEWKSNVYGQCKSWLDGGLQPRAVSRDLDWGIPVPAKGLRARCSTCGSMRLSAIFPTPRNCCPTAGRSGGRATTHASCTSSARTTSSSTVSSSLRCSVPKGSYILPENVPANEFLNLEGDKISTSRNWAVWLNEYLVDLPGKQDVLRYVLTANAPETKDNDFTWRDFQARNNNELVAVFGNFVNRALVLTSKYFEGKVPALGALTDFDRETLTELSTVREAIERELDNFHFREALKEAMNLARLGNKYLADTEPWKLAKTDMERVATILNISLQITANLAIAFAPFLPMSSEKLC